MSKAPSFQFYPNDWSHDLEEHPLEIEGAWIRICCKLWWSETRGKMTRTLEQWSRLLGIPQNLCEDIFTYILTWKIGDVEQNGNGQITVTSRRMFRAFTESEFNRLRQCRWRGRRKNNGPITQVLHQSNDHSSSSSSSSKKEIIKRKKVLNVTDDEFSAWIQDLKNANCYSHLNIDEQLEKCILFFKTKNIIVSKPRFLNWLNNPRYNPKPITIEKPQEPGTPARTMINGILHEMIRGEWIEVKQ